MKSLRLRLALISTAISGVVNIGFGLAGWMLTAQILQESLDLRLSVPLDRIVRDLHPQTDLGRIANNLEVGFGDDIEEGRMRILLLDRDGSVLFQDPEGDWPSQLDSALLSPVKPVGAESHLSRPPERGSGERLSGPGREPEPPSDSFPGRQPPPRRDGERSPATEEGIEPLPGETSRRPHPPRRPHERGAFPGFEAGEGEFPQGPEGRRGPPRMTFLTLPVEGLRWRVGIFEDRGYLAVMTADLSTYEMEIRRVRQLFFLALPFCLAIIGLGGWFVARRALRPVDLITKTASQVTAHGLDQRIPREAHEYREMSYLVDVLNGMMDRLEDSFRHAMRFSADVSHELKTPLAVMQATVQTALKECEPGSREEENLMTVSQETERLKRITRSLMLLAQADAGQLAIRSEEFSLSREVEAICEDVEILCEKAKLDFESEIQPDLVVRTDPVLLRQAIQNIVSNAVKYNHPGGRVKCRLFRYDLTGERVIEVSNTGPGIPEEEEKKIFERFYRVDQSRSRDVDGFGLGLNLASEIVEAMGGELRLAESTEEITRFEIRLKGESNVAKAAR